MEASLALHSLAVLLLFVPFVLGAALLDKLHEVRRSSRHASRRIYEPLVRAARLPPLRVRPAH